MTNAPTESHSHTQRSVSEPRRTGLLIAWALALSALHVCLVGYFEPFAWLSSSIPITGVDFDTHAEQTFRVIEGLEGWGKSWVYDVRLQAGFPNGTIFDADNKLWELWSYGFVAAGATPAVGYNSFVFLAHFLIIPWIYASGRTFRLAPERALLAATLAAALWLFDSYAHWFWWIGTVAYIFAAYFYLLPLALFYRFCSDGKLRRLAIVTVLLALAHLLHPYSFFVLAFPMLVLYLRALRRFTGKHHGAIGVMILIVVAANAYWLQVAIQHWHYVLNSAFFGQSHPGFLLADFFNVVIDPSTTGYLGTRAAFRWLALVATFAMLWLWRREQDDRFMLFASALLCMFVLAYIAPVLIPPVRQIQPYRFVASASFLAVFPAAELLHRLWEQRAGLIAAPLARAAAAIGCIVSLQHFASDILYFMPDVLPALPQVREAPFALTGTGFGPHLRYRHPLPKTIDLTLDRWIDQHAHEGRIAVTDWTGERFAWSTRAQILGGFVDLNLAHAHAHPVRWVEHGTPTAEQLRKYIDTYAVKYFVVRFGDFGLPALPELVSLHASFADAQIYRAHASANYFFAGSGQIDASTNRIAVTGSVSDQVLELKYHWHEALVCKPGCRVERVRTELDPVGFIRIPAPHPGDLTIENSYKF